jgi:putative Ca2+/H+ antiporter (TMEM165/GDT1 family)
MKNDVSLVYFLRPTIHKYNHSLTLSTYALIIKDLGETFFLITLYLHFKNQLQFRLLSGVVTPLLVVKARS